MYEVVFKGVFLRFDYWPLKKYCFKFSDTFLGYLLDLQLIAVQVLFWGSIEIMRYILVYNGMRLFRHRIL